jgi:hypothetical protein
VSRIAGECTSLAERGAVGIRPEPAAAIDENRDGTRGSNLLSSSSESRANLKRERSPLIEGLFFDPKDGMDKCRVSASNRDPSPNV